jgi:hypothetical protein
MTPGAAVQAKAPWHRRWANNYPYSDRTSSCPTPPPCPSRPVSPRHYTSRWLGRRPADHIPPTARWNRQRIAIESVTGDRQQVIRTFAFAASRNYCISSSLVKAVVIHEAARVNPCRMAIKEYDICCSSGLIRFRKVNHHVAMPIAQSGTATIGIVKISSGTWCAGWNHLRYWGR